MGNYAYGNEAQVGEAIRRGEVARRDVFVTTKPWINDCGYDEALHGFERSVRKLGFDTLDRHLLHQPMPNEWERTVAAWKAAERLLAEGRARAIGYRTPARSTWPTRSRAPRSDRA